VDIKNISAAPPSSILYAATHLTVSANGDLYRCNLTIGSCTAVASTPGTGTDSIPGTARPWHHAPFGMQSLPYHLQHIQVQGRSVISGS